MKISDFIKPTAKQQQAFKYVGHGHRLFYGGARGGGKTRFALDAAMVSALQYEGLRVVCIRETYPELEEAFILNMREKYPSDIFGYRYTDKNKTAFFDNGSRIIFRACDSEEAAKKIQGIEFQLIIIDEANNFEVMTLKKIFGSLRGTTRTADLGFIPSVIMTGNPGGLSDPWFKSHFINPDYKYWSKHELKNKDNYVYVSAKVMDNKYVSGDYIATLEELPDDLRQAWLHGDWTIFQGQFFEEWSDGAHVIQNHVIPDSWPRKAAIDLGWSREHPTVVLFAAQNPVTQELVIYDEYVGIGVTEQYVAEIKMRLEDRPVDQIFADPSMWTRTSKNAYTDESPARIFLKEGIHLTKANNDRVNGWRIVKQWLHWTMQHQPRCRFFTNCNKIRETIPTLKYSKHARTKTEDLDTRQADDAADALRYLLVTGYGYPSASMMLETECKLEKEKKRREAKEVTAMKIFMDATGKLPHGGYGQDSAIMDYPRGIVFNETMYSNYSVY